jgi:hypothetical protein
MVDTGKPDAIGYGKPPKHSRYKKGESGNPGGRPRGSKNRKNIVMKIMMETAIYREGEKRKEATKLELLLRVVKTKAAKGDMIALDLYEHLLGRSAIEEEQPQRAVLITARKMTIEEWEAKYGCAEDLELPSSS